MSDNVRSLRATDSEKLTINLGYVDLGRIDLLVQEGFYSNRSDFIRTAIRAQLGTHAAEVARTVERHMLELGLREFDVADLEAARAAGVTPELARATIASLTVLGALQASPAVKAVLADRIS